MEVYCLNNDIQSALAVLYQRQITSRDQLLTEALRVALTKKAVRGNETTSELFSIMKQKTEETLGFFPADRNDFRDIYDALKEIDLGEFTKSIYENDRSGEVITPTLLTQYIQKRITALAPETVLITDAERHLNGLTELVAACPGKVTLTTQLHPFEILLRLLFEGNSAVDVRFISIYSALPKTSQSHDYIFCLPAFGGRVGAEANAFLTQDYDGVALENLLGLMTSTGTMDFITPAKLTFASGGYEKLRRQIADTRNVESLYILPDGTFRPWTAIKTYLLSITGQETAAVSIGELKVKKDALAPYHPKAIPTKKFRVHGDWRIELLLSEDDRNIARFKKSDTPKVKLGEVAEVFRGKSILKKDAVPGEIAVLNIGNIENGVIDYEGLDTIAEDERKIKRYELQDGDVILSCRGTAIKSALFRKQEGITIASANIIVIRSKGQILPAFIQMFLDSPTGQVMVKSFQRGVTIMNINHTDIMELEIPLLPLDRQRKLTEFYEVELTHYRQTVAQAEQRLQEQKNKLYDEMI